MREIFYIIILIVLPFSKQILFKKNQNQNLFSQINNNKVENQNQIKEQKETLQNIKITQIKNKQRIEDINQEKYKRQISQLRLKKEQINSIYYDHHQEEPNCSHCFVRPVIRGGKCLHQTRCSYCANEDEKIRRIKLLEKDIIKCQTDHERDKLEEKKQKLEQQDYKPSQCVSPLSENYIAFGHSLNSYCVHRCTPPGGQARFKKLSNTNDLQHDCVLKQCVQASGHIKGYDLDDSK